MKKLMIFTATDTLALDMPEVVWIIRVKDKFWSRLAASLSLGTSYTKASDVGQLSFNGNANFRKGNIQRFFLGLDLL